MKTLISDSQQDKTSAGGNVLDHQGNFLSSCICLNFHGLAQVLLGHLSLLVFCLFTPRASGQRKPLPPSDPPIQGSPQVSGHVRVLTPPGLNRHRGHSHSPGEGWVELQTVDKTVHLLWTSRPSARLCCCGSTSWKKDGIGK